MKLNLETPLAFFDLETTGINIQKDRIVEISIVKVFPDGTDERLTQRINPTIPIPKSTTDIHGISDEDVKNEPTFCEMAQRIYEYLEPCDLAGYNSARFDIPVLMEEFLRCGIHFDIDKRKTVDVQRVFHLMEKRTLEAAYKFFCDKDLENAHSAEADALATYEVLKSQLDRYDELKNDVKFLQNFTKDGDFLDAARRFVLISGIPHFNFGKHKGRPVEDVLKEEPGYYDWMMKKDFALHTKERLKQIKLKLSFK